jgi:putative SOS response-associated peptidase YedK
MCARYTLLRFQELARTFDLLEEVLMPPRYNIAPTQKVITIGAKSGGRGRGAVPMHWGFVPHWANSPNDGPKPVNARSETVRTSAPFRDAFRSHRCIIPADGFYEWLTDGKKKRPHYITRTDGGLLAFAGIWDVWKTPGTAPLYTCAILTVPANAALRHLHDRMPAILTSEQLSTWLDASTPTESAHQLLATAPNDLLQLREVSTLVNKATNEGPECLAEVT